MLQKNPKIGYLFLLLAFFVGAIQNVIVKEVSDSLSIWVIVFTQYLTGFVLCVPSLLKNQLSILKSTKKKMLLARALAGLGYFFCMFYSLHYIPLMNVALLTNMSPIWVLLISTICFRARISIRLVAPILLGFVGVMLVLKPEAYDISVYSLLALMSGILMALSMLAVRALIRTEPSERILIYYFFICVVITFPFAYREWRYMSLLNFLLLILNGLLMYLQQEFINKGWKLGSPVQLGVVAYSNVIYSAVFGLVLWREIPTLTTLAGSFLIIIGSYFVITHRHQ